MAQIKQFVGTLVEIYDADSFAGIQAWLSRENLVF